MVNPFTLLAPIPDSHGSPHRGTDTHAPGIIAIKRYGSWFDHLRCHLILRQRLATTDKDCSGPLRSSGKHRHRACHQSRQTITVIVFGFTLPARRRENGTGTRQCAVPTTTSPGCGKGQAIAPTADLRQRGIGVHVAQLPAALDNGR